MLLWGGIHSPDRYEARECTLATYLVTHLRCRIHRIWLRHPSSRRFFISLLDLREGTSTGRTPIEPPAAGRSPSPSASSVAPGRFRPDHGRHERALPISLSGAAPAAVWTDPGVAQAARDVPGWLPWLLSPWLAGAWPGSRSRATYAARSKPSSERLLSKRRRRRGSLPGAAARVRLENGVPPS